MSRLVIAVVVCFAFAAAGNAVAAEVKNHPQDILASSVDPRARSTYEVLPTSALPGLDTALLEKILKQRLSQAVSDTIRDQLDSAAKGTGKNMFGGKIDAPPRAVADVLLAMKVLASPSGTLSAQNQVLVGALVRGGLTSAVYVALESAIASPPMMQGSLSWAAMQANWTACGADQSGDADEEAIAIAVARMDAIYEGLAKSSFLAGLGFVEKEGTVSDTCLKLQQDITFLANLMSTVGLDGVRDDALAALKWTPADPGGTASLGACQQVFTKLETETDPAKIRHLLFYATNPTKARSALSLAVGGEAHAPCAGTETTGVCGRLARWGRGDVELARIAELATSFRSADMTRPSGKEEGACFEALEGLASAFDLSLSTTPRTLRLADLPTLRLDSHVSKLEDALNAAARLALAIAGGARARRDDVVAVVEALGDFLEKSDCSIDLGVSKHWNKKFPKICELVKAAIDSAPSAIVEDATSRIGIRMDTPSLASIATARFLGEYRDGFYLRGTVGAGGVFVGNGKKLVDAGKAQANEPTFFEELGFGFRYSTKNDTAFDVHAVGSGLMYQMVEKGVARNSAFVGIGGGMTYRKLVEVSLNYGLLFPDRDALRDLAGKKGIPESEEDRFIDEFAGPAGGSHAVLLSIQVPIGDYLAAVANGDGKVSSVDE